MKHNLTPAQMGQMTSLQSPCILEGSAIDRKPLKHCDVGNHRTPQGGGVQVTQTKWACSSCWKSGYQRQRR